MFHCHARRLRIPLFAALLGLLLSVAAPAQASIDRSAFDTLYNDPALATLRNDLQTLGYTADTLFGLLTDYDAFVAAIPDDPALFSPTKLRSDLNTLYTKHNISNRIHQDTLGRMANMFWVELVLQPAWRLKDLSPGRLRDLYLPSFAYPIGRGSDLLQEIKTSDFQYRAEEAPPNNPYGFTPFDQFLLMPLAHKITNGAASARQAAERLAAWLANNLFHTYTDADAGEDWSDALYTKYAQSLLDAGVFCPVCEGYYDFFNIFRERAVGCHRAARLLKALAIAINIPALSGQVDYPPDPHGGHGATFFPALDAFAHGDWIADLAGVPGNLIVMDRAAFIQTLAAGHKPDRQNDDYLDHSSRLNQRHASTALRRSGDSLYLQKYPLYLCQGEKEAILQPLQDMGFTFTCASSSDAQAVRSDCATAIACTPDGNKVPLLSYGGLIKGWRPAGSNGGGTTPPPSPTTPIWDANGNNKVDLPDIIRGLQILSGE